MPDHISNKKVLVILGSPRKKGNSFELAQSISAGVREAGGEVETVYLNGLKISPCQACNACHKEDRPGCAVDDDMQTLYPKIREADALVMASPVYWFTISAQTKLFMDRWYAFGADNYQALAGKKAAVAMSFGDADPFVSGCVNALRTFQDAFAYVGVELAGMVYGSASEPGELKSNQELADKAFQLGRKLVTG